MPKIYNIEEALALFKYAADGQARATETGDYKSGNKCYKDIVKSVQFIKQNGGLDGLKELLFDEKIGVRMRTASYLLGQNSKEAELILMRISAGKGIHALTAETTLTEWRKGNLKM